MESVTNTELGRMISDTHGMLSRSLDHYASFNKLHEVLAEHLSYLLDVQKRRAYLSGMSDPTEMELDKMEKKIKKA